MGREAKSNCRVLGGPTEIQASVKAADSTPGTGPTQSAKLELRWCCLDWRWRMATPTHTPSIRRIPKPMAMLQTMTMKITRMHGRVKRRNQRRCVSTAAIIGHSLTLMTRDAMRRMTVLVASHHPRKKTVASQGLDTVLAGSRTGTFSFEFSRS